MTDYGGMGGITGGRPLDPTDMFEADMNAVLGERMRASDALCVRVWSSLANCEWSNADTGDTASYSFRAAGDLIAAIIGRGDYMDFYCSGPYATPDDEVESAMATRGWTCEADHPVGGELPGV